MMGDMPPLQSQSYMQTRVAGFVKAGTKQVPKAK